MKKLLILFAVAALAFTPLIGPDARASSPGDAQATGQVKHGHHLSNPKVKHPRHQVHAKHHRKHKTG